MASLLGLAVVMACLIWVYRELTLRHLIEHQARANATVTRVLGDEIWARVQPLIQGARGRTLESLRADPAQGQLQAQVAARIRSLQIVRLKVYDLDGLTVFSTDTSEIGEDKSHVEEFQRARRGMAASGISRKSRLDSPVGALAERDLVYSFVPLGTDPDAAPQAVFEVYSDVTETLQRQQHGQWQMAAVVLALLGALYALIHVALRRADRTIERQEAERAAREAEIQHQAHHDALTGLANRTYFLVRLGEALALATRSRRPGALLFIDLDRFKIVNDSLGHNAGDELLKAVAERIRLCMRRSDLLFRMGGDEFTVILPEVAAPEDASYIAHRIIDSVSEPVVVLGHRVLVGATIGIAVFPGDGDDAQALVKNADAAMYTAKQQGRGSCAFYSESMNERATRRLRIEGELRKASLRQEFVLFYQPRFDAVSRRVVALEALLRWNHPERGLTSPAEFIDVLEDSDLVHDVGAWVLRTACLDLARWTAQGVIGLRVSVNVSARQFQSQSLSASVGRVLRETGIDPSMVELELTESTLITHPEQAQVTLELLKALGVRVALDDFGTGYSSLGYLQHYSVDTLKIDKSFAREVETNPRDRAVAKAFVQLGQALGLTIVAEGVETEAQARFFAESGCNELQGYLFRKPCAAEDLADLLRIAPVQRATNTTAVRAGTLNVPVLET